MGCATGIVRFIVFVVNFCCVIVGISLIALGAVIIANVGKFNTDDIPISDFLVAPGLILGLGVVIFLISFFGCCGACKNNSCMLTTYAVILTALFIIQLAFGIYGYVKVKDMQGDKIDSEIEKEIEKGLLRIIEGYKNQPDDKDSKYETLNLLQYELKCCGSSGKSDYYQPPPVVKPPWSCCKEVDLDNKKCKTPEVYYDEGCTPKLIDTISHSLKILGIVAMSICAVEFVGAVFAFCLASHARHGRR